MTRKLPAAATGPRARVPRTKGLHRSGPGLREPCRKGPHRMAPRGGSVHRGRKAAPALGRPDSGATGVRPSLGGGTPAQERELGRQGRQTVRKLLEAGLAEFDERGFQAVRVDDVVRRAKTSHGTFYLYFANKDDLFKTLLRDALHDMEIITGDFPVVTRNDAGREALRAWVGSSATPTRRTPA